jgi:hypothetical protein
MKGHVKVGKGFPDRVPSEDTAILVKLLLWGHSYPQTTGNRSTILERRDDFQANAIAIQSDGYLTFPAGSADLTFRLHQ